MLCQCHVSLSCWSLSHVDVASVCCMNPAALWNTELQIDLRVRESKVLASNQGECKCWKAPALLKLLSGPYFTLAAVFILFQASAEWMAESSPMFILSSCTCDELGAGKHLYMHIAQLSAQSLPDSSPSWNYICPACPPQKFSCQRSVSWDIFAVTVWKVCAPSNHYLSKYHFLFPFYPSYNQ